MGETLAPLLHMFTKLLPCKKRPGAWTQVFRHGNVHSLLDVPLLDLLCSVFYSFTCWIPSAQWRRRIFQFHFQMQTLRFRKAKLLIQSFLVSTQEGWEPHPLTSQLVFFLTTWYSKLEDKTWGSWRKEGESEHTLKTKVTHLLKFCNIYCRHSMTGSLHRKMLREAGSLNCREAKWSFTLMEGAVIIGWGSKGVAQWNEKSQWALVYYYAIYFEWTPKQTSCQKH